jgi:hypothetical protein
MSPTASCIPWAFGVPAAGGHPIWWDNSGPVPQLNKRIDDPRWQGAMARTYPESGTGVAMEHAMFRALYDTDASGGYLYLSWWIQVDPFLTPLGDRVTIGFQNTATNVAHVIRVNAFAAVPETPVGPIAIPAPTAYDVSGTTISQRPDVPDWIGNLGRSWVDKPNSTWALHLRVPMFTGSPAESIDDTGIALGTIFKMWYEVKVTTTASAGTILHTWPRNMDGSTATSVPDPAGWGDFQVAGGIEGGEACAAGVWLDAAHVGTTNTDAAGNPAPNLIKWSTATPKVNTFFAAPKNDSGAAIPRGAGGLHARFRLANWGSKADWNDVPDPAQLWTNILPGGDDAIDTTPAPNPIPTGQFGNITFDWTMTSATSPAIGDFEPPGPTKRRAHQCMLVELSGTGIDFGRSSVYRNMDFDKSSTFSRAADVSVEGLGALGTDSHRTVYLFVQTLNMPANIDPKPPPPEPGPGEVGVTERIRRYVASGEVGDEPPTAWEIAQVMPTHLVHVYHATADTFTEDDGTTLPILRPQTSFGVFLQHDGPLFGWDHQLQGGALQELAPNFYRLRVPNDGVATITTRVVAHEKPRAKGGCLALLLAFVAFLRRLFKR